MKLVVLCTSHNAVIMPRGSLAVCIVCVKPYSFRILYILLVLNFAVLTKYMLRFLDAFGVA